MTNQKNNNNQLVIELPRVHTQLIPAKWIEPIPDISHQTHDEMILFSLESLRAMFRMVSKLKNQTQPEVWVIAKIALTQLWMNFSPEIRQQMAYQ